MRNIFLCAFLIFIVSCTKHNRLKDFFINNNDYWVSYDEADPGFHSIYYKFGANGISDTYCRSLDTLRPCTGSDVIIEDIPWQVTNDSILKWGQMNYHIITCNESVIVLYTTGELRRHIFLIKEYPNNLRKSKFYYENLK